VNGAGEHSGAEDDDVKAINGREGLADLLAGAFNEREIEAAIVIAGSADANEREVRGGDGRERVSGGAEAIERDGIRDEMLDAGFDDGAFGVVDERDFEIVDINAGDIVALVCKTGC